MRMYWHCQEDREAVGMGRLVEQFRFNHLVFNELSICREAVRLYRQTDGWRCGCLVVHWGSDYDHALDQVVEVEETWQMIVI